jgi:hypothetical protein
MRADLCFLIETGPRSLTCMAAIADSASATSNQLAPNCFTSAQSTTSVSWPHASTAPLLLLARSCVHGVAAGGWIAGGGGQYLDVYAQLHR